MAVLHALVAATIEKLLSQEITPPVFLAGNVDGGIACSAKLLEQYKNRMFYL